MSAIDPAVLEIRAKPSDTFCLLLLLLESTSGRFYNPAPNPNPRFDVSYQSLLSYPYLYPAPMHYSCILYPLLESNPNPTIAYLCLLLMRVSLPLTPAGEQRGAIPKVSAPVTLGSPKKGNPFNMRCDRVWKPC